MPKKRPAPRTPIEAVGKELESLRGKHGWSQGDFAKLLELSRSGYQLYERGVRGMPLDKFFLAASILGVRSGWILDEAESDYRSAFPKPTRPSLTPLEEDELGPAPDGTGPRPHDESA